MILLQYYTDQGKGRGGGRGWRGEQIIQSVQIANKNIKIMLFTFTCSLAQERTT